MPVTRSPLVLVACLSLASASCNDDSEGDGTGGRTGGVSLPVAAIELVADTFGSAEGIAFNGEGRLFVVGDTSLWEIDPSGTATRIVGLVHPVGIAAQGATDILVAEFGPLTLTADGPNDDGTILVVTPGGDVTTHASGIGDPNFVYPRDDGSLLVSDDFTDQIYQVATDGTVTTFLQGIQSPNGLVESLDRSELYVAQTFTQLDPLGTDDRVWKVPLTSGSPGTPELLAELGDFGANDGVALDAEGRLYVAANLDGRVWRIDPATGETTLVAEELLGVASLAFGEGEFNPTSLYATQLFGGRVWEIPVGVEGAAVNR